MRSFLALILALAVVLPGVPAYAAAPLSTTVTTVTVTAPDGRSFSALLAQPTGSAPGAYPVIAFGHGFTQAPGNYRSIVADLASRGFIVIAPGSETSVFPSHSRFADDLWRALEWVRRTQPNASQAADAVSGHSMGGGAAVLAAARHPEIDAIGVTAAAETNPSAAVAAATITAPALFVVGSRDTIVPATTTRKIFDAKPAAKTWQVIEGGYHCGFLDKSSFLGFGCDSGSITRAQQLTATKALLGDFFTAILSGR